MARAGLSAPQGGSPWAGLAWPAWPGEELPPGLPDAWQVSRVVLHLPFGVHPYVQISLAEASEGKSGRILALRPLPSPCQSTAVSV